MSWQGTVCKCETSYTNSPLLDSEICVSSTSYTNLLSTASPSAAASMVYRDVRATDAGNSYTFNLPNPSIYILKSFASMAIRCADTQDRHACQSLVNMCALHKYAKDSTPCRQFESTYHDFADLYEHGFLGTGAVDGWKVGLPYVYQPTDILSNGVSYISTSVQLNAGTSSDGSTTGSLKFRLYSYTFNGTLIGWEYLTDQLQLCGGDSELMTKYLRFGTNYANKCRLDLSSLLTSSASATVFYDLYFEDVGGRLFPVPVKVLNLPSSLGSTPNRNSDAFDDELISDHNVLTTRFYVVDRMSGVTNDFSARPTVLSYARSIRLHVEMLGSSSTNIKPPLLVIDYGEREVASIDASSESALSDVAFKTEYIKSAPGLWQAAYGLFGTALILSLALVGRRLWIWQSRNGDQILELNLFLFIRFIVYMYASLGDLFFIMLCCLTFYTWIFYKGQQAVYYLLPSLSGSSEVYLLRTFIIVCFVAKLVDVLFKIYQQLQVDVFFVDWEKPKENENNVQDDEGSAAPGGSIGGVSVWRKLFAANKWNDLQSIRQINVPLTLFFMIFLMEPSGIGLKYLATAQPDASNLDSTAAPLHPLLSFAVETFFLLVICYGQLIFRRQVFSRYFKDDLAQFVDLLCTSNISCMVLDGAAHGYYMHGKTVHPHADVSLEELTAQLRSEEKTLTRQRGLQPGKDCYEMYLTAAWRNAYDDLYTRLLHKQTLHAQRAARAAARGNIDTRGDIELAARSRAMDLDASGLHGADSAHLLVSSTLLRANASLNIWLCSFIQREPSFPFPYEFGQVDPGRRLLGLPIALPPGSPATFVEDRDFAFTEVLLCGIEGDLILLLVLLYALCSVLFQSSLVAILVCFIVDRLLVAARSYLGQINISRKTLLDERFLI